MKPHLLAVLEIAMMKKQAADLYDEIDARVALLHEEFGDGRFDYDLSDLCVIVAPSEINKFAESLPEDKRYFKFEIVNNLKKMEEEGVVWKSTPFKPLSFSSGSLKGCPKSLK